MLKKAKNRVFIASLLLGFVVGSVTIERSVFGAMRAARPSSPGRSQARPSSGGAPITQVEVVEVRRNEAGRPTVIKQKVDLTQVPDGATFQLHPLDLHVSQTGLGHAEVEERLENIHLSPGRAKLLSTSMRVGGQGGDLYEAIQDAGTAGSDLSQAVKIRLLESDASVDQHRLEGIFRRRYDKSGREAELRAQLLELSSKDISSERKAQLVSEIKHGLVDPATHKGKGRNPGWLIEEFLTRYKTGDRRGAVEDFLRKARDLAMKRFQNSPLDMWLIHQEPTGAGEIDESDPDYWNKIAKAHQDAITKKLPVDLANQFRGMVDVWTGLKEPNRAAFANILLEDYQKSYQKKVGGNSPVIVDPSGELSLSDGHHGLRKAYDLMNKILELNPSLSSDPNLFKMNLQMSANFLHKDRDALWNDYLLDVCQNRQLYLDPEGRAEVIRKLLNEASVDDFIQKPEDIAKAAESKAALEDAKRDLKPLEDEFLAVGPERMGDERLAALMQGREIVSAMTQQYYTALAQLNQPLAKHLKSEIGSRFEANIEDIRHDPMRSFVGNLLPHLSWEAEDRRKGYRAKIGNEGLHDYAEFYVSEWLVAHGFQPRFNEKSVRFSPPSAEIGSFDYQNQMANYINTMVSMAEARELMFGRAFRQDFRGLLGRITREDRLRDYLGDLERKHVQELAKIEGMGSPRKRAEARDKENRLYQEFHRSPVEKFDAQVARYEELVGGDNRLNEVTASGARKLLKQIGTQLATVRGQAIGDDGARVGGAHGRNPAACVAAPEPQARVLQDFAQFRAIAEQCDDPMITRKIQAALAHPLFAPGTCLNPLGKGVTSDNPRERSDMEREIRQALIGGGAVAAAADVAGADRTEDDIGKKVVSQRLKAQGLNSILDWLREGGYNPK